MNKAFIDTRTELEKDPKDKQYKSPIDKESLVQMIARKGDWYAYQNLAMDSTNAGHLQFMKCGEGCTHKEPPKNYHDTEYGMGWKYFLVGKVDMETGDVTVYEL